MNKLVTFNSMRTEVIEFRHRTPYVIKNINKYPFCVLLGKSKVICGDKYLAVRIFRCSDKNTKNYWIKSSDLIKVTDEFINKTVARSCAYPLSKWLDYKYSNSSKYHCK